MGLTSTAFAESGVQLVQFNIPQEIPADGVLPMFGSCFDADCSNLQSVIITDISSGTRVEGHVELVRDGSYSAWSYFVPSVPFRSGASYIVRHEKASPNSPVGVSFVARDPAALDESALGVMATLTKVSGAIDRRCCSTCIDVTVIEALALTTRLSPAKPIASQYLFELSTHAEGQAGIVVVPFGPPSNIYQSVPNSTSFDGSADSYCYTVRARPLVGGEPFTLMTRCLANDFTDLGRHTRSPEEVAKWAATCEVTPERVDAGVSPRGQVDAALDADGEPLGAGKSGKPDEDSGCQLADGRAHLQSTLGAFVTLFALALGRRRRAA
ncbi:MAG TPA: hypothetical protein VI299_02535 [Polyangiales bacterium]